MVASSRQAAEPAVARTAKPGPRAPAGVAPTHAAVLELQRTAGNAATGRLLARMAACPSTLQASDPTPSGWKPYFGPASVFHCGFRGILEDRAPTPDDPQNECFYDDNGRLVDADHPFADCGGTPNQYNSSTDPISHATIDRGGIVRSGWSAFWESRFAPVKRGARAADSWFRRQRARWLYGAP